MNVLVNEWIFTPDEDGNGLLEVWVMKGNTEFPMPIETHRVAENDVNIKQEQCFEIIAESAGEILIYSDKEQYKELTISNLDYEAFIPAGLFSPSDDPDFVPSSVVLMNGTVIETYENPIEYGFEENDILVTLSCLGHEFNVVIDSSLSLEKTIQVGNIVCGAFWIQGWPEE